MTTERTDDGSSRLREALCPLFVSAPCFIRASGARVRRLDRSIEGPFAGLPTRRVRPRQHVRGLPRRHRPNHAAGELQALRRRASRATCRWRSGREPSPPSWDHRAAAREPPFASLLAWKVPILARSRSTVPSGSVTGSTYAGAHWTITIEVATGQAIEAATDRALPAGTPVELGINPRHIVLLSARFIPGADR